MMRVHVKRPLPHPGGINPDRTKKLESATGSTDSGWMPELDSVTSARWACLPMGCAEVAKSLSKICFDRGKLVVFSRRHQASKDRGGKRGPKGAQHDSAADERTAP